MLPFLALEFVAGTRKGEKIRYYLWLKGGEASIELWLISLDRIWFYTDKAKFIYCLCRSRKTCRIRLVAKGKSRVQTRTSGRRKLVKIDFITTSGNVKGTDYGRPISFFSVISQMPIWADRQNRAYFWWYYFSEILSPFIPSRWFCIIQVIFSTKR